MSSPIVMKGKLYTLTRVGEVPAGIGVTTTVDPGPQTQEAVVCLDAKTGKPIWQWTAKMYQTDDPFHRIGWSNVVGDPATGRVYALGAQNEFVCLDGDTGKEIWKHQMTEEYGLISTFGGRTPSPALNDDLVYIAGVAFGWGDNAGAAYRIFAFDKTSGQPVWTNSTGAIPTDAPYQTPVITVIGGQKELVCGSGDGGTYGFQARTGKKIWAYKGAKRGFNDCPVVIGDKVFVSWDLDNFDSTRLGRVVCLDASQIKDGAPKEVWRLDGIEAGFPSATYADGVLYVLADSPATLYAINADTGKLKYKKGFGTIGKASLVWADGKIYLPEANGRMWILKPGEKKFEVLSHVDLEEKLGREYVIFGSVAISDGHVYLQAANKTYCIGPKDFQEVKAEIPAPPIEYLDNRFSPTPVLLQVVPCDVSLHPGQTVQFTARGFDAMGRPVGQSKPQWSIGKVTLPAPRVRPAELNRPNSAAAAAGAATKPTTMVLTTTPAAPIKAGNLKGTIDDSGLFTAAGGPIQGGAVMADDGKLGGFARVRVFPPLPWKFDFEKNPVGKPPLTWIGAGMKFAVRDLTPENKVLVKLTDIPLFARARTYFGTPNMSNYTLQGDVMVKETVYEDQGHAVHKIPDAGIINTRYVLELKGTDQFLSLHDWPAALPRVETEPGLALHTAISFTWGADSWYHLKLMVQQENGKAICRGKAWREGLPEPADWMVTVEDTTPSKSGSPGLWGFSNDHEIYYDNLMVTANAAGGQASK
jgi:outer membrane protein assembly factor BamB